MQFLNRQKAGRLRLVLLFIGICFCWIVLPTLARAETGAIADNAQVLNTATIRQYSDKFTYTVDIFTTRDFQGSNDAFDASLQGLTSNSMTPTTVSTPTSSVTPISSVTPTTSMTPTDSSTSTAPTCDPKHQVGCELFNTSYGFMWRDSDATHSIEIGIDVPTRHLAIYSGKSVFIAQDHYGNAIKVFADTMHQTHDNYTQAVVAALDALQNDNDRWWDGVRAQAPWFLLIALIIGVILFAMMADALGLKTSSSSSESEYERRRHYDSWHNNNSGGGGSGGGGFGGGSSGGGAGGGGGGASGNF